MNKPGIYSQPPSHLSGLRSWSPKDSDELDLQEAHPPGLNDLFYFFFVTQN